MDPNVNLSEQRELALAIRRINDKAHSENAVADQFKIADYGDRLAELVEALDTWIMAGGFLPDSWEIARKRAGEQQ